MKTELINKIQMMLFNSEFSADETQKIISVIQVCINDYDVVKKETALSTTVENDDADLLQRFFVAKAVEGCSKRTLEYYKQILKLFFLQVNKSVRDVTADDIRYYLAFCEINKGKSKVTLDNELRVLKSFYKYLTNEELIDKNPAIKISSIKKPKIKKKPFTEREVEKIRKAACNSDLFGSSTLRNTMIIEVLLSTGCRISELAGIKLTDINEDKILVHGKGAKDRYVYLSTVALMAVEEYLKSRTDDCPFLVYEPRGEKGMQQGGIGRLIRQIGEKAGVENCHAHRFRRTCATMALNKGMPMEQVSKMLGHETLDTTQIYAESTEENLRYSHKRFIG